MSESLTVITPGAMREGLEASVAIPIRLFVFEPIVPELEANEELCRSLGALVGVALHQNAAQIAGRLGSPEGEQWPCMIVKNGQIEIVGVALLKDGRYPLLREGKDA